MVTSFKGYYEIIRILLDRKADVNKTNAQGISLDNKRTNSNFILFLKVRRIKVQI